MSTHHPCWLPLPASARGAHLLCQHFCWALSIPRTLNPATQAHPYAATRVRSRYIWLPLLLCLLNIIGISLKDPTL